MTTIIQTRFLYLIIYAISIVSAFKNTSAQNFAEGIHYITGKPVRIFFESGKIQKIINLKKSSLKDTLFIAPGLIDNQVNGFAGISFALGNNDLTFEGIEKATSELWKYGVTTYLPTLTTNSQEILVRNFKILANAVNNQKIKSSIPGFHLEGPFINPEDGYRGAHPRQFVQLPSWDRFLEMYNASGKKIIQITLAPEMEGAMDFIKKCRNLGIVVALGHHNASKEIINQAVSNGAQISTHLGNGCSNLINRHYNPFWPQLANKNLMASIICDGFHLLPEEIEVFYMVKGKEKTILTSDVTSFATLSPGQYKTQTGEIVELSNEGRLFYPAQNVLYGSASPILKGLENIIKITGCSVADAIQMASSNPAILYKLPDRGFLDPGLRADIIIYKLENRSIVIKKTFVNGDLVFDSDNSLNNFQQ